MPDPILDDDDLMFADEKEEAIASPTEGEAGWPVLVVDDDHDIHTVTGLALGGIRYRDRRLSLLSAHSAAEAKEVLKQRQDIAVILLDVVMETDDAGLQLVRWIREELNNQRVRIILRTGQPGLAPEREVIVSYQINDYKAKTELTADRLFTTIVSSMRSYEDLCTIEKSRHGLELILDASGSLMQLRSVKQLGDGVLMQMGSLLGIDTDGMLCIQNGHQDQMQVLASAGRYQQVSNDIPSPITRALQTTLKEKRHLFTQDYTTLYLTPNIPGDHEYVVFMDVGRQPPPMEQVLLQVFCHKLSLGIENAHLFDRNAHLLDQLQRAQKATVVTLADFAEFKDQDTGDHVLRVAEMSEALAREVTRAGPYANQLDEPLLDIIGMASILHDVGKMAVPDSILQKPGRLSDEERAIMQTHVERGYAILSKAASMTDGVTYLSVGAEIAGGHHERFDGKGYPNGLAGQQIPLTARIVALADVYDALGHQRPYKPAWPREKVVETLRAEAGTQFDPVVVEAFLRLYA